MKSISFFIALRYLRQSTHETTIGTMVRICFLSIALGTFSLALITAIMHGFEYAIHEKIKSIHPQIMIRKQFDPLNAPAIQKVLTTEFPSIIAASPSMIEYAIIQSHEESPPSVIMIQGIDPTKEELVTTIGEKLLPKRRHKPNLSNLIKDNQVIIGKQLADAQGVHVGDTIQLYYLDDLQPKRKKVTLDAQEVVIGGIFETGIDEFDSRLLFAALPFTQSLFPESGISVINLKVEREQEIPALTKQLATRLGLDVVSWEDLYPALVSALKLEKYAMFFILTLVTLVASMNMIALLFMQITQKKGDIAILKAMGMPHPAISHIFMWLGISIALIASTTGLLCALAVSYALERFPFIQLPDAYYVSHLPAKMDWQIIAITFTAVMIISIIATWIPIRRIRQINIAQVLRFEGA